MGKLRIGSLNQARCDNELFAYLNSVKDDDEDSVISIHGLDIGITHIELSKFPDHEAALNAG